MVKKGLFDGKGVTKVVKSLTTAQKYELIHQVIERFNLTGVIHYFCDTLNVSRSGYYRYFSESAKYHRLKREEDDLKVRDVILNVFHRRGYKKGSRQIKMTLENELGIIYSLKRIRRIMRKFDIICPHRKKNPYKKIVKATEEHRVVPNRLNREFRQEVPGKVLLTDITYVYYGKGQLAYLSTILDGSTNEILSYHVSDHLKMPLVTETIEKLFRNKRIPLHPEAFIHSDQGAHYTSPTFQNLLKKKGLGQSMSRKGNCWDNAPQESFFGHFKDEALLKECQNLEELKREIKRYMMYHNTARYQWDLKKMTPVGYRNHLLDAA